MTKVILDKRKYDELIKLEEDFDGELSKSRLEQRKWYENEINNYKEEYKIIMCIGYIIALLEFIYILIK